MMQVIRLFHIITVYSGDTYMSEILYFDILQLYPDG